MKEPDMYVLILILMHHVGFQLFHPGKIGLGLFFFIFSAIMGFKIQDKLGCSSFGFEGLAYIDVHSCTLLTVPNSMGNLKHLRYLDLSNNYRFKTLPNSMTKPQNLQTLKLSFCYALVELPRDFKKLVSLRHLYNYECS